MSKKFFNCPCPCDRVTVVMIFVSVFLSFVLTDSDNIIDGIHPGYILYIYSIMCNNHNSIDNYFEILIFTYTGYRVGDPKKKIKNDHVIPSSQSHYMFVIYNVCRVPVPLCRSKQGLFLECCRRSYVVLSPKPLRHAYLHSSIHSTLNSSETNNSDS